jgi:hypothetical protein
MSLKISACPKSACCVGKYGPCSKQNESLTDALVVGMVRNKANGFVTSGIAILIFYMIRYLSMSEILHYK